MSSPQTSAQKPLSSEDLQEPVHLAPWLKLTRQPPVLVNLRLLMVATEQVWGICVTPVLLADTRVSFALTQLHQ